MIVAEIASGHVDGADLLFLVAVVLFAVAAVLDFQKKAVHAGLVSVGLCAVALGWLLL